MLQEDRAQAPANKHVIAGIRPGAVIFALESRIGPI